MITRSLDAMQSAGWWGNGGMPKMKIPFAQDEAVLPNFIYAFGWAGGILVLLIIFGFIGKTFMTTAYMKDEYGKLLFAGIGSMFVIQYLWGVAMIFGYAPFVGLSLPFVSYGGTDQIIQFAAIGLLLGAYRRRNMITLPKVA
jgi:cell division protein FtsW (lipid II flippase)